MLNIHHASGLRGELSIPGDKSISHRSIMLGAIAEGTTRIRGFLKSADCLATIDCFRRMGIEIREEAPPKDSDIFEDMLPGETILTVEGKGLRGLSPAKDGKLDAKNSGTTARLISGILAGQPFRTTITGDSSLSRRPMARIIRPLSFMGADLYSINGDNCLPLSITGGDLSGIQYESRVASAQVKSCVLLAGLYADRPTFYREPYISRNHTELMLGAFGANLKTRYESGSKPLTILYPGSPLKGQNITVPGDISSAAFFIAAGLITDGSEITLKNVGINETRDGLIRVIRAMGGDIRLSGVTMEGRESVADITVRSSDLNGITIGGSIIPSLIDEIPVIAVLAACARGKTVIRDAAELKVKESNRITAVARALTAMGIDVTETDDGLIIEGGHLKGAKIDPGGDHRMAMAFSVAALAARGTTVITDEGCVDVSYPTFYEDLESLM